MEVAWLISVGLIMVCGGILLFLFVFLPRKSDGNNSIDLES